MIRISTQWMVIGGYSAHTIQNTRLPYANCYLKRRLIAHTLYKLRLSIQTITNLAHTQYNKTNIRYQICDIFFIVLE